MASKTAKPKAKAAKPAPKAAPKQPKAEDPRLAEAYERGRKARSNSIDRTQAPLMADDESKHWLEGWDFEDKVRT